RGSFRPAQGARAPARRAAHPGALRAAARSGGEDRARAGRRGGARAGPMKPRWRQSLDWLCERVLSTRAAIGEDWPSHADPVTGAWSTTTDGDGCAGQWIEALRIVGERSGDRSLLAEARRANGAMPVGSEVPMASAALASRNIVAIDNVHQSLLLDWWAFKETDD